MITTKGVILITVLLVISTATGFKIGYKIGAKEGMQTTMYVFKQVCDKFGIKEEVMDEIKNICKDPTGYAKEQKIVG